MKTCTKCKQSLSLESYNKNKSKKDGLNNICKECSKSRSKQYYSENREHHKNVTMKRNKLMRTKSKRFVDKIKSFGCTICIEKAIECIDFHHLKDKKTEVSDLVRSGNCLEIIKTEIRKCIRVCSNCHRKIHSGRIQLNHSSVLQ